MTTVFWIDEIYMYDEILSSTLWGIIGVEYQQQWRKLSYSRRLWATLGRCVINIRPDEQLIWMADLGADKEDGGCSLNRPDMQWTFWCQVSASSSYLVKRATMGWRLLALRDCAICMSLTCSLMASKSRGESIYRRVFTGTTCTWTILIIGTVLPATLL